MTGLLAVENADIGWAGAALAWVAIAAAAGLSWAKGLGLERSIVWSAVRAMVQLALVGGVLAYVLADDRSLAPAWAWVALMVVIAAVTVRNRAKDVPGALPLALVSLGLATSATMAIIFGLGIFDFEARSIVPVAGMLIGNSMTATVVAARRVVGELNDHRAEVEVRLALGQPSQQAARPYVREALRTAMSPQVESTKITGLIALPGMMTGLILAGVEPTKAVQVQAAIMFLILGSVAITVVVIGTGLSRRLFTVDHRLVTGNDPEP